MNKEKEIEKFSEAIDRRLEEANAWIGSMNKGKGNWIAKGLFPTYRKADEVRKETAKDILQELYPYIGHWLTFKALKEKYGVEVE